MAGAEAEAGSTPAIVAAIFFFAGLSGLCAGDLDGLGDFGGFGNLAVILVSTFWFVVYHDLHFGTWMPFGEENVIPLLHFTL